MLCGLIEKDCMQISYWELFSDILKWFRECLSDSNTTSYTSLIDSECVHIQCHFMDKDGESFDNNMRNLHPGTCRQSSTGFTPFILMYVKEAKLPAYVAPSVEMPTVDEAPVTETHDQSTEVQTRLQAINHLRDSIYHKAESKIKMSLEKQKRLYNSRNTLKYHFTIGDQVLKWNFRKRDRKGGKLTDSWLGLYTVQKLTKGGVILKNQIGRPLKPKTSFSDIKTFVSRSCDQSSNSVERSGGNLPNRDWLPELMLRQTEKYNIVNGNWLDDKTMDAAQSLIKQQFGTKGLDTTLLSQTAGNYDAIEGFSIQIHHVKQRSHWLTSVNVDGDVKVMDSLGFRSTSDITKQLKARYAHNIDKDNRLTVHVTPSAKQLNRADFGVYAIAYAIEIVSGGGPNIIYDSDKMRQHLIECLETSLLTPFPRSTTGSTVPSQVLSL